MYAYYRAFLLITEAGWRDITIVRDNSDLKLNIRFIFYITVTLAIYSEFYILLD